MADFKTKIIFTTKITNVKNNIELMRGKRMKKKYLGLVSMALLGLTAVTSETVNPTTGENVVQAATKKNKPKLVKFKKNHDQFIWGPYRGKKAINLNRVGTFTSPATFSKPNDYYDNSPEVWNATIQGYTKIKGKKYYYEKDDGGKIFYYNPISLKKPILYRAKSNIKLYWVVSKDLKADCGSNRVILPGPAMTLKKGSVVGIFDYLKPYTIDKCDNFDKMVTLKGKTILNVQGKKVTMYGGKYIEILLENGHYMFMRASDKAKLVRSNSGSGYLNFNKLEANENKWISKYNQKHKKKIVYDDLSWKAK